MKNRYGGALGTKSGGFGVIGWLLLIPIAIIVLIILVVSVFEGRKAYWDYRVKEMCEKDGRIQVYERVAITERYLDKDRNIKIPLANSDLSRKPFSWEAKPSDLFFYEMVVNDIETGSPTIKRFHFKVVRSVDQKVLGESTSYSRIGGDFPTFAHPSSYICPENVDRDLFSAVFEKLN